VVAIRIISPGINNLYGGSPLGAFQRHKFCGPIAALTDDLNSPE